MNKSEKTKQKKYRESMKEAHQMIQNPTPQTRVIVENYFVFNLLYLNDTACNAIKFLESDLIKRSYKGKWAKTLYNAAMKRVNAYFEFVEQCVDTNSLANLFVEMDNYVDNLVIEMRAAIRKALQRNGYPEDESRWIASVETAYTMCDYAIGFGNDCKKKMSELGCGSNTISIFNRLFINSISQVMRDFTNAVVEASPYKSRCVIDLGEDEGVKNALERLSRVYMNPKHFSKAIDIADQQNEEEGTPKLM